ASTWSWTAASTAMREAATMPMTRQSATRLTATVDHLSHFIVWHLREAAYAEVVPAANAPRRRIPSPPDRGRRVALQRRHKKRGAAALLPAGDPRRRTSRPRMAGWYRRPVRYRFPGGFSMRLFSKLAFCFLLAATVARAQSTTNDAAAKADAPKPAAEPAAAAPAEPKTEAAPSRPYVDSAITFLTSLSHTNRSGDAGAKAWADLRSVSGDKVPV